MLQFICRTVRVCGWGQVEENIFLLPKCGSMPYCIRLALKRGLSVFLRTDGIARTRRKIILAVLLALLSSRATASAEVLVSRYVVNLDGLHVGDATLRTD